MFDKVIKMRQIAKFYTIITEDYSTEVLAYNVKDALRVARLLCDSPIVCINNAQKQMVWNRNSTIKVETE